MRSSDQTWRHITSRAGRHIWSPTQIMVIVLMLYQLSSGAEGEDSRYWFSHAHSTLDILDISPLHLSLNIGPISFWNIFIILRVNDVLSCSWGLTLNTSPVITCLHVSIWVGAWQCFVCGPRLLILISTSNSSVFILRAERRQRTRNEEKYWNDQYYFNGRVESLHSLHSVQSTDCSHQ